MERDHHPCHEKEASSRGMRPVEAYGIGNDEGLLLGSDEGGQDGDLTQGRQGTAAAADVDHEVSAGVE